MDEKAVTVSLPATARKGFGRPVSWSVSLDVDPTTVGTGPSLTEARAKLAGTAEAIIANATAGPAFAYDDDGGLVVAVPYGTGSMHYKLIDGQVRMVAFTAHAAQDSLTAHHYTRIPTNG